MHPGQWKGAFKSNGLVFAQKFFPESNPSIECLLTYYVWPNQLRKAKAWNFFQNLRNEVAFFHTSQCALKVLERKKRFYHRVQIRAIETVQEQSLPPRGYLTFRDPPINSRSSSDCPVKT